MTAGEIEIKQRAVPAVKWRPSEFYFAFLQQIHGLLENTSDAVKDERIVDFVLKRLNWLEGESDPARLSIFNRTFYKGFIHPQSDVLRNEWSEAMRVNDMQLYVLFLKTIDELRRQSVWAGRPIRDVVAVALQETLGIYFGTFAADEETEKRNTDFYLALVRRGKKTGLKFFSISELRDKGAAVCFEKAVAAQNLMAFKGLDSFIVFSAKCAVKSVANEPPHVYNIVHSDRGFFIYDPTNPSVMKRPHGETIGYRPAAYAITKE
ncbi:MAG: hypothetical protein Q7R62_00815, partial [bacterium]|nr:hypothetical protein [bacterium]